MDIPSFIDQDHQCIIATLFLLHLGQHREACVWSNHAEYLSAYIC